jgi:alpha-methylacyl-CoA racemase
MIDGVSNMLSLMYGFMQGGMWTDARERNLTDGGAHFYGTYRTSDDKYVAVGAIEARFYAQLLAGLGLTAADLPAQHDQPAWPRMRALFSERFATRTRDEWVQAMQGYDACFSPVLDLHEAPQHPQLRDRESFILFDGVMHPAPAPRFERTGANLRRPAPHAGQHTLEVLDEWGVPLARTQQWVERGAVRQV